MADQSDTLPPRTIAAREVTVEFSAEVHDGAPVSLVRLFGLDQGRALSILDEVPKPRTFDI